MAYKGFHYLSVIALEKILNETQISSIIKKEIISIFIINLNVDELIKLSKKTSERWLNLTNLQYQFLKILITNLENKNEIKLIFRNIYNLLQKNEIFEIIYNLNDKNIKILHSGYVTGPAQLCQLVSAWNAKGAELDKGMIFFLGKKDSSVYRLTHKIAKFLNISFAPFNLDIISNEFWIPNSNPPAEIGNFLEKNKTFGFQIYEYFDGWNNYHVRSEVMSSITANEYSGYFYLSSEPSISSETIDRVIKFTPRYLGNKENQPSLYSKETIYENSYLKNIYSKIPNDFMNEMDTDVSVAILCTSPISHRISLYERKYDLNYERTYKINLEKEQNLWESVVTSLLKKNKYDHVIIKLHPRTEYKIRLFLKNFSSKNNFLRVLEEGVVESIFEIWKKCDIISPPSTTCFTASELYSKEVYLIDSDEIANRVSNSYKYIDLGKFFPNSEKIQKFRFV